MNKLSALVADRTGNSKKSQYQSIQDATYSSTAASSTGADSSHAVENLEYGRSDSAPLSGFVGDWMAFLRRYACTLAFITTVVLLLALQGQRAAHRRPTMVEHLIDDNPGGIAGGEAAITSILHRPCQFYSYQDPTHPLFGIRSINTARRMPRVIQTSLGEPANQWGEVACMYYDGGIGMMGGGATMASDVKEYGLPTAGIKVDFASGPTFPQRKPILGFGGAFTEATALNYRSLNKSGREAVMELLFGSTGLGYR